MGQNKVENQIREQLNSREIQPSAQAWDRLDAMLSVAEGKKQKRSFGWLYIAAGIVLFVSAGLFFFSQNGTEINTQHEVVGTEVNKDALNPSETTTEPMLNELKSAEAKTNNKSSVAQSNTSFNQSTRAQANGRSNQNQTNTRNENNQINRNQEIKYEYPSDVALKDLPKIVDPKREVTFNRPAMTDEELLASLDNSAKQSANKKTNVKVDPKNLLSQVDGELEMTFRQKVINKVSKKYKEIEVAVANRNKE